MAITEITTKSIKDGDILNADINASAAIAKSKLAALDIVNADVNASAAIAKSKLAALDIVNADVNASAAIAGTKVSPDFGSQNTTTTGSVTGDTLVGRHGRAPTNTQGSTYTLVAADAGKVVKGAGNITLNENIFADGDMLVIYNSSGGDITLIQGSNVTLRLAGDSATGTRTIAQKGVCTVINVAANEAVAGGIGVS
tara:strand:- start:864 stop:1457 length:594 start_codon:yes stop_codon:yes gene_type:complete